MNIFRPLKNNTSLKQLLVVLLFGIVLFSLALFTVPTHAQETTGLVTCGLQHGTEAESAFCTICDLIVLIQNIMNKAMYIFAAPIAAFMLGYGGFLMVRAGVKGGDTAMYGRAKTIMTNAIIGIVIIFCSWLLIDTLMKALGAYQYATGANFGPWNKIECSAPPISLPKHMGCTADQRCKSIDGSGSNTCTSNYNCTEKKHLECSHGMCQKVAGIGTDDCSYSPDNCPPERHVCSAGSCVATTNPSVTKDTCDISKGNSDCEGTVDSILDAQIAEQLANLGVPFVSSGSCTDASGTRVSPQTNFNQIRAGVPMTICSNGCTSTSNSCTGTVTASAVMLTRMQNVWERGIHYQVTSISGGSHGKDSDHYQGKAIDVQPKDGVTYRALATAFRDDSVRFLQCEDSNRKQITCDSSAKCDSGGPCHLHVSYRR